MSVLVEVEVGDDKSHKWIVARRHQREDIGTVVKAMLPPLPPNTLVTVCVQAFETENRLLRNRLMAEGAKAVGPSAGFAVMVDDLRDLNDYKVQLYESQGVE